MCTHMYRLIQINSKVWMYIDHYDVIKIDVNSLKSVMIVLTEFGDL